MQTVDDKISQFITQWYEDVAEKSDYRHGHIEYKVHDIVDRIFENLYVLNRNYE